MTVKATCLLLQSVLAAMTKSPHHVTFVVSQCWRPQVQDQSLCGLILPRPTPLGLGMAVFPLGSPVFFLLCLFPYHIFGGHE